MFIRNVARQLYHTKPLKIKAHSLPDGIQISSQTVNQELTVTNPLESFIASLAACELSTFRVYTKKGPYKFSSVKFEVESGYDVGHFMHGGPDNKINDITVKVEV